MVPVNVQYSPNLSTLVPPICVCPQEVYTAWKPSKPLQLPGPCPQPREVVPLKASRKTFPLVPLIPIWLMNAKAPEVLLVVTPTSPTKVVPPLLATHKVTLTPLNPKLLFDRTTVVPLIPLTVHCARTPLGSASATTAAKTNNRSLIFISWRLLRFRLIPTCE